MTKRKKRNLIMLLVFIGLMGCSSYKEELASKTLEILDWSFENTTVIIKSNQDLVLDNAFLRQGDRDRAFILKGIRANAKEPTIIKVPKGFLNKEKNLISVGFLVTEDTKRDA